MEDEDAGRLKGGSATDISYSLRGLDFPVEKHDLIQHARQHSANKEVIDRLTKIEDREYDSIADVVKQIGKAA
jgi:hypothetical protein